MYSLRTHKSECSVLPQDPRAPPTHTGSCVTQNLAHVLCSRRWHTSPESQDGQRAVGLVAGVAVQSTAPEVMMPQVPKGRLRSEVLQGHSRGHSGQRRHDSFLALCLSLTMEPFLGDAHSPLLHLSWAKPLSPLTWDTARLPSGMFSWLISPTCKLGHPPRRV